MKSVMRGAIAAAIAGIFWIASYSIGNADCTSAHPTAACVGKLGRCNATSQCSGNLECQNIQSEPPDRKYCLCPQRGAASYRFLNVPGALRYDFDKPGLRPAFQRPDAVRFPAYSRYTFFGYEVCYYEEWVPRHGAKTGAPWEKSHRGWPWCDNAGRVLKTKSFEHPRREELLLRDLKEAGNVRLCTHQEVMNGLHRETEIILARVRELKVGPITSNKSEALAKAKELRCATAPGANVDWSECEKRSARLRGANLASGKLAYVKLSGADLAGANLSGADLTGADLTGANLAGANLERARLRGASLRSANLTGAKLAGADLRRAALWDAKLAGAVFHGARLDDAWWTNGQVCRDPAIGRDGAVTCQY